LNKKISKKDQKDWNNFLNNKDKLFNKDKSDDNKNFPLVKTIDLHGYSLDDANLFIEKFILKSYEQKVKKIVVITGKGLRSKNYEDPFSSKDFSILKNSVPNFVQNNEALSKLISKIESAEISDGGEGAFYIYLKNKL
tara:strand:- start:193 stop:606 length:414 start_codon:yes stop_codon:yes gene_type:complete